MFRVISHEPPAGGRNTELALILSNALTGLGESFFEIEFADDGEASFYQEASAVGGLYQLPNVLGETELSVHLIEKFQQPGEDLVRWNQRDRRGRENDPSWERFLTHAGGMWCAELAALQGVCLAIYVPGSHLVGGDASAGFIRHLNLLAHRVLNSVTVEEVKGALLSIAEEAVERRITFLREILQSMKPAA